MREKHRKHLRKVYKMDKNRYLIGYVIFLLGLAMLLGLAKGEESLVSIISSLNTEDPEQLVSDLLWYSSDDYRQYWNTNSDLLKKLYVNYINNLIQIPFEQRWLGFHEDIIDLYTNLANLSEDNVEKTRFYIYLIDFIEDNYIPELFYDNYGLGKAFLMMSVYHPGKLSREGCIYQAIDYFTKAFGGNLILGLQCYYNELAKNLGSPEEIKLNLGTEMQALLDYNNLLRNNEGEDLQSRLFETLSKLKRVPERYKDELLRNPPEPQEHLDIEDAYLTD